MKPEQFKTLTYITSEMLTVHANAKVEGMDYDTVLKMDNFASDMMDYGYCVRFLMDGCNTGKHSSPEHPKGKAIDFTLERTRPDLPEHPNIWMIITMLCYHGFKAIGVYKNSKGYFSFHADPVRHRQWFYLIKSDVERKQLSLLNEIIFL